MDLSLLIKEALDIQSSGFIEVVKKAVDLLRKESGQMEILRLTTV
jgi:hypothetical protein